MTCRHLAAACLAAATLGLAGHAQAAAITWTLGPSFGGPLGHQGILTNGSLVEATHLSGVSGGPQTVVDPGGLNLTFTSIDSPHFDQSFLDPGNNIGDPGWSFVVRNFEWNWGTDVDAADFLDGLIVGRTYQVQLFSGRSMDLPERLLSFGDGEGHWSPLIGMAANSFVSVVGTFIADAATQRIQFNDNTENPTLSAYVLRDVSVTAPVPEPGSWMLALAGLLAMSALARRR